MSNLTTWSLKHRAIIYFLLLVLFLGGVMSFMRLGKKEDSVFVIKTAAVACDYPGATPEQVEQLITIPIEREIQGLEGLYKLTSESRYGTSRIRVELDPATPASEIQARWDALRRRTLNIAPHLPEGASAITVSDNFGDVYGLYYALMAEQGFSWSELREVALQCKTRLEAIAGVEQVVLYGEQQPVVNLYISLSALAGFSVRPEAIVEAIRAQNSLLAVGHIEAGEMRIALLEGGSYNTLEDLENQLLTAPDFKQFRLGDVARVERGYREPPTTLLRVKGARAIGLGISTHPESDVVEVGTAVREVLQSEELPLGMELLSLYPEDEIAREATNTFLVNLVESLLIVIGLIMLLMGLREGVVIGSSLLFAIGGTLLMMGPLGEGLNRTSLAGFIIAMGMLVDNAIVVVDGARQRMAEGMERTKALIVGAEGPMWSLLGATLIGILSFLPLYLAPASVAEIIRPLFVVVALSLLLSWLLALTQTPLIGVKLLKNRTSKPHSKSRFLEHFERVLQRVIRYRGGVLAGAVLLFIGAVWMMGRLPQNFFPELEKPYFRADVLLPEGYDLRYTEQQLMQMSDWLEAQPEVKCVSCSVGGTPPRYYLASSSVGERPNFGNLLVELHEARWSGEVEARFSRYVTENQPNVWLRSSLFKLSPVPDAAIEFGFIGPNLDTLIRLADTAKAILERHAGTTNIRLSCGNRIPVWQPRYSQMRGQRIGISRSEVGRGLQLATTGYQLGEYREGDRLLPILLREESLPGEELSELGTLPIFNPSGRTFSLEQALSGVEFRFQPSMIAHYNRERVIKAQCDPLREVNTIQLLKELQPQIEKISLPKGYRLKIFGEAESQNESNRALGQMLPLTALLMVGILILLFGNYRDPLAVLAMLPLMLIGVVAGLMISGKAFNFFALLGLLGLVGMNIKNGVVLVAEITRLKGEGYTPYQALIRATSSRVLPVVMASGTTILGMIPLLFDALFGAMAITIMGGLLIGTLLTVGVLPALYATLYRIKTPSV